MANIKLKPIDQLETWNTKELRKLRITIKNRMESLSLSSKKKELPPSHPLHLMDIGEIKNLLEKVQKAERILSKQ